MHPRRPSPPRASFLQKAWLQVRPQSSSSTSLQGHHHHVLAIRLLVIAVILFGGINVTLHATIDHLQEYHSSNQNDKNGVDDLYHHHQSRVVIPESNRPRKRRRQTTRTTTTVGTRRQEFEKRHGGFQADRIRAVLEPQRAPPFASVLDPNNLGDIHPNTTDDYYDIYHCPLQPPLHYPMEWNALEVLEHWNIDQTALPHDHTLYQGLCVFDWNNKDHQAHVHNYRQAEVPFVLQNHPQVLQTAERWSTPHYVQDLIPAEQKIRNEHATGNHFMFWRLAPNANPKNDETWKAPTEMVELTFAEWYEKAMALEQLPQAAAVLDETTNQKDEQERWYFRLNAAHVGDNQANDYLYDEMPFFDVSSNTLNDSNDTLLFMVEPAAERGINCRFGMKGIFAEAHFDPTRNWIMVFRGQRRYLLAHPQQCQHLQLYPMDHPSGRHSQVDWSRPRDDIRERPHLAGFANATLNEVVLQPGDALYLPTSWFHAIVSLNLNFQCNARSGVTFENMHHIHECGFGGRPPPPPKKKHRWGY